MSKRSASLRSRRREFLRALALGGAAGLIEPADAAPLRTNEVPTWDVTTDLLVVGSGAGGISAALEARSLGLDVLAIERYAVPGGGASLSGGVCYLGGGTALQKSLGFDDTVEEMFKYLVAA